MILMNILNECRYNTGRLTSLLGRPMVNIIFSDDYFFSLHSSTSSFTCNIRSLCNGSLPLVFNWGSWIGDTYITRICRLILASSLRVSVASIVDRLMISIIVKLSNLLWWHNYLTLTNIYRNSFDSSLVILLSKLSGFKHLCRFAVLQIVATYAVLAIEEIIEWSNATTFRVFARSSWVLWDSCGISSSRISQHVRIW